MEASWRAVYWAREILVCRGSVDLLLGSAWEGGREERRGGGLKWLTQAGTVTQQCWGLENPFSRSWAAPAHLIPQGHGRGEGWDLQHWHPWSSLSPTWWLACKGCYLLTTD